MPIKLKNNVVGYLATAISASDTGLVLQSGNGASFPTLNTADYFYATLVSTGGTQEVVKVTARVGDTMTVVRAQEGSSAAGFAVGTRVEMRVTAQSVLDVGWYTEAVSIKDFGAVGDGVTDDTAAIQAAVNTEKPVFVPPTDASYFITTAIAPKNNQVFFGVGAKSKIKMSSASTTQNVISATGRSNVTVRDLAVYASGGSGSLSQSGGIAFIGCSYCVVDNCLVENHRGAGINIFNSNNCKVTRNTFLNSPVQDLDPNTVSLADIYVGYSSSNNIITNNLCMSGQGTGISLQSVQGSDTVNDNVVDSNIVQDCKAYGIIAYRNDDSSTPSQEVKRNVISNNVVKNIKGTILNSAVSNYSFGAGIYLQGAEHCVVTGNVIEKTHSGSVTFTELLAPGAIGTTNSLSNIISNNVINDPKMFGIYVGDPNNFGIVDGVTIIANNDIRQAPNRSAIKIINRGSVKVEGNTVSNINGYGVWIANTTTQRESISIVGNQVKDTTNSGIAVFYAKNLLVTDNIVDTAGVHGVSVSNCDVVSCNNNVILNHATRGLQIATGVTNCVAANNIIKGDGSSVEGVRADSQVDLYDNRITECVSAYVGAYAPFLRILPVNDTTPSVKDGRYFSTANTLATTITNFDDAISGQEIQIFFNDNNTTLKFSGVTNLKGNAGVDRLMVVGDSIRAVRRAVTGASSWAVTIIEA